MGGGTTPASVLYDVIKKHAKEMKYTVAMEDPVARPMFKQWVSGSDSRQCVLAVVSFSCRVQAVTINAKYESSIDSFAFGYKCRLRFSSDASSTCRRGRLSSRGVSLRAPTLPPRRQPRRIANRTRARWIADSSNNARSGSSEVSQDGISVPFEVHFKCIVRAPLVKSHVWGLLETRVQLAQSAALYCRVSTAAQSCARQEQDLKAFAKKVGYKIPGDWKVTASGAKDDRKHRKEILDLAQAFKIDVILVTELTRWGRSMLDLLHTLQDLQAWNVSLTAQTGLQLGRRPGQRIKADRHASTVLQPVGAGQSCRELSHRLGLSKNTVLDIVKRARAA